MIGLLDVLLGCSFGVVLGAAACRSAARTADRAAASARRAAQEAQTAAQTMTRGYKEQSAAICEGFERLEQAHRTTRAALIAELEVRKGRK